MKNEPAHRLTKRRQTTPAFSFLLFFSLLFILTNFQLNFNHMSNYVGVDISKKDFYACFNEASDSVLFLNNRAGFSKFKTQLKKENFQNKETIIGVESTGIYHLPLSLRMSQYGFTVNVINPLIVKKQNQISLRRVKNDQKDAALVRFCAANGNGYKFIDTPETLTLKSMVRQRDSLSNMKNIFQLKQQNVRYKEKNLKIAIGDINQELFDIIEEKMEKIQTELGKYRPEEQKLLRSIPGVGPITAVSFISEVGAISRFSNPKKLIAYVGLDSRVHQSGTSVNGRGYISKRGNKILRTRLYNACSVAVLRPNMFKRFFDRKRSEGKPYKVALCATMNKMAHVIYAVWKRGTPFVDMKDAKSPE
jgi:transposase